MGLKKSQDIQNHGICPQQILSNLVAQSMNLDLLDWFLVPSNNAGNNRAPHSKFISPHKLQNEECFHQQAKEENKAFNNKEMQKLVFFHPSRTFA